MYPITVTEFKKNGMPLYYAIEDGVYVGAAKHYADYFADSAYTATEKNIVAHERKIRDSIWKINGNIIGGHGHENGISLFFESERRIDSIVAVHFPFVPHRTIYFNRADNSYKWQISRAGDREYLASTIPEVFDIMPIALKQEQWYLMKMSNASNIIDNVFIYINKRNKVRQHHEYGTNWNL
jgi:hypothetical protein